jgi:phosphoglycolate phosphatase-like HAD superfamily hydrolase
MKMDGMTDRQIAAALLELEAADPALIERVLDALDACALAPVSAPRPIALAGVAEVMKKAAGLGHVNALLTGNTPTRARVKVTNAGYSADTFAWAASAFGDQTPRRSDLAQHIVHVAERRGLVPLIIGDTPHDARAAASVGIAFCGVASGAFTAGELLEHESVVVIEDFVHGAADFFVALDALAVK